MRGWKAPCLGKEPSLPYADRASAQVAPLRCPIPSSGIITLAWGRFEGKGSRPLGQALGCEVGMA
jgi:hypothetical protein